jgi:hypothetical protein
MGRVLLIIGAVAGGLIFAVGVLGLIITITSPGGNPASEYRGAFGLMAVGAIVAAPCIYFARRAPVPGAELRQSYMAWFAWCQQALGGDAISLHAATMAALAGGPAGNPTAAASAEAARQASRIAASGALPAPTRAAKVRSLAEIGASTVGLLEPSERVLVSFTGTNRPALYWGLAFGAIGTIIASSQMTKVMVTVTDRRVIAVGVGLLGGLANKVALMEPRSTVSVKFPKGIFGRTMFSLKGQGGGSVEIIVPRPWRREAEMALELLAPPVGQVGSAGIIR